MVLGRDARARISLVQTDPAAEEENVMATLDLRWLGFAHGGSRLHPETK